MPNYKKTIFKTLGNKLKEMFITFSKNFKTEQLFGAIQTNKTIVNFFNSAYVQVFNYSIT